MAVPPQPPSAVIAQPPGLAASTAMSFYQQRPAVPLQARAPLPPGLDRKGAGRGAGWPGWDDDGRGEGHAVDEDAAPLPAAANQQQFVPGWTCDASGQWIWIDWHRWRWTVARGWWQVPMQ